VYLRSIKSRVFFLAERDRATLHRGISMANGEQAGSTKPSARSPFDTVRPSAEGLAKVLGDLEARVLRTVWDLGRPAPAREVHARVAVEHPVVPVTVITVLNKLVQKGLLTREKREGVYHYTARYTEDELTHQVSDWVVGGLLSLGPRAVVASFVDVVAQRDPEELRELERLIQRRLAEEEKKR
jgi:predicted transcriptional regulator